MIYVFTCYYISIKIVLNSLLIVCLCVLVGNVVVYCQRLSLFLFWSGILIDSLQAGKTYHNFYIVTWQCTALITANSWFVSWRKRKKAHSQHQSFNLCLSFIVYLSVPLYSKSCMHSNGLLFNYSHNLSACNSWQ